jgi:amidase
VVDGVSLEGYMGYLILTCAITVTACPVVSLPGGFTKGGLPVGLQLVGPPRSEAKLLAMAAYVERALDVKPRTPIDPR